MGLGLILKSPHKTAGPSSVFRSRRCSLSESSHASFRSIPRGSLSGHARHTDGGERQACRSGAQQPCAPVLLSGKTYLGHFEPMLAEDPDPRTSPFVVWCHMQFATVAFSAERGNYGFEVPRPCFLEAYDVGLVTVEPRHDSLHPSVESVYVPGADSHGGGEHISYETLWPSAGPAGSPSTSARLRRLSASSPRARAGRSSPLSAPCLLPRALPPCRAIVKFAGEASKRLRTWRLSRASNPRLLRSPGLRVHPPPWQCPLPSAKRCRLP